MSYHYCRTGLFRDSSLLPDLETPSISQEDVTADVIVDLMPNLITTITTIGYLIMRRNMIMAIPIHPHVIITTAGCDMDHQYLNAEWWTHLTALRRRLNEGTHLVARIQLTMVKIQFIPFLAFSMNKGIA